VFVISGAASFALLMSFFYLLSLLAYMGCHADDGCVIGAWCKHGFCWDCLASHKTILESDNSAHKAECPWHPNNIKD
jgi:hypothetical protein